MLLIEIAVLIINISFWGLVMILVTVEVSVELTAEVNVDLRSLYSD